MKKQTTAPLKKPKKAPKIALLLALLGAICIFFFAFSQDQKDQVQLLSLQTDMQNLRAQVRQLEFLIQEANQTAGAIETAHTKEDLVKLIFWQQLIAEVWSGQSFKASLDQLREVSALELEKTPHMKVLLDHESSGLPTVERLWIMIDEPQEYSSHVAIEDENSFWTDPLKYFQSQLDWNKFFIIRTQANEATRRKLKKLIAQRNFTKAMDVLKESDEKFPALESALTALENAKFALKILEERVILSLVSGGSNEK